MAIPLLAGLCSVLATKVQKSARRSTITPFRPTTMFSAALRSAVAAPRPFAVRSAYAPFAPLALRAYSTPADVPPPTSEPSTPSQSRSQSSGSASGSGRPLIDLSGARKRFSPNEDPDAWWKAESAARRFGVPGNQYSGRSLKVVGGFTATYKRLMGIISNTGVSTWCLALGREGCCFLFAERLRVPRARWRGIACRPRGARLQLEL